MVVTKRAGDFSDSNSDDFGIQLRDQTLTKMRDDDVEAMIRRRKKLKTTTTTTSKSEPSPGSKMCWTKDDELVILGGIVDYEKKTKSSYRSDWSGFYHSIKDYIDANCSKQQLVDKVKTLKKKFTSNQSRAKDGKELSFTNTHDDEIFKLSMIIWGTKDEPQTQHCGSNEKNDQEKQERVSIETDNGERENGEEEEDGVDELCEKQETLKSGISFQSLSKNGEKEKSEEYGANELCDKQDTLKSGISFQSLGKNGEKEKNGEEDCVDELRVLQEALEADTWFQNLCKYQQKLLLQNLKKLGADKRKELTDECRALFAEELQLNIKKLTFSAKLAVLLK